MITRRRTSGNPVFLKLPLIGFVAVCVAIALLSASAPSLAVPSQGTASVDEREVAAGTQELFVFSVTNPAGASTLNQVRIGSQANGALTISEASAELWSYQADPDGWARFVGSTLPSGTTQEFFVIADAAVTQADSAVTWQVQVSDNGGQTFVNQVEATPGALTSTVRVLTVDDVVITSPQAVVDGTATEGQQNIGIESVVTNHASVPLDVTATMVPGVASQDPDPQQQIPSGESRTFSFTRSLGSPGTTQLIGDASARTAPASDAMGESSDPVIIQAAPSFSYSPASLTPVASVGGARVIFRLALSKANPPALTFNRDTTRLTLTHTPRDGAPTSFTTTLTSPLSALEGSQSLGLEFAPVALPALPEGSYTGSLAVSGTDDNGKPLSATIAAGTFKIDNAMPYAVPTLGAPAGQIEPNGRSVVKDGDMVNFGGVLKQGTGTNDPLDTTATILDCDLVVTDKTASVVVSSTNVPLTSCRNDNGNIAGSFAPTALGTSSGFVRLDMVARRAGDTRTPPVQSSQPIAVDNDVPGLARALKGCDPAASSLCDDKRTIRVHPSELVKGDFKLVDFAVESNAVVAVDSDCTAETFCDQIRLTLGLPMAPGQEPIVTYDFKALGVGVRPQDGAGHMLANGEVRAEVEMPTQSPECEAQNMETGAWTPQGEPLCTHGGDSGEEPENISEASGTTGEIPCPGDGVKGKRLEVIYAYPRGQQSRYDNVVSRLRSAIYDADTWLDDSTARIDQHFRWLCNRAGNLVVRDVKIVAVDDNYSIRGADKTCVYNDANDVGDDGFRGVDIYCSLINQREEFDGPRNYYRQNRIYIVFLDGRLYVGDSTRTGAAWGIAGIRKNHEEDLEPGPAYAFVNTWETGFWALHEIGHTLGAVVYYRDSAGHDAPPHATVGGHCWEEWDVMCYDDYQDEGDGEVLTWDEQPQTLQTNCDTGPEWQFDCHKDDYYDPKPQEGEYLYDEGHPNTARNLFLTKLRFCNTAC